MDKLKFQHIEYLIQDKTSVDLVVNQNFQHVEGLEFTYFFMIMSKTFIL
jgi:hypothetical protein